MPSFGGLLSNMLSSLRAVLRDRSFTIRNLLHIKNHSNPMIIRWLMALSVFSFKIEFIPGVNNDIADSMSRLCRNNMIDFLFHNRNPHLKLSCLPILSCLLVSSTIPLVKSTQLTSWSFWS
jgi:hypothetical protein